MNKLYIQSLIYLFTIFIFLFLFFHLFILNPFQGFYHLDQFTEKDLNDSDKIYFRNGKCFIHNYHILKKSSIVYTWINGTEECHRIRRKNSGLTTTPSSRDKQMGELQYSLRSLLKYASWLEGHIYIVTPGQIPDWLYINHSRITLINQEDLFPPNTVQLPTFNTNAIEQYLYKIPGLTETFIYMNDDYLFVKPITPHHLFTCDGGLRFLTEINHIRHVKGSKNNVWLSSVRNTIELMDKTYGGQHVYNFNKHAPFVYSKKAFIEIHNKFKNELLKTSKHIERNYLDLNIPLLHHIYMNEEGSKKLYIPIEFNPLQESEQWRLVVIKDNEINSIKNDIFDKIIKMKGKEILLALNDGYSLDSTVKIVQEFYQQMFPEKGLFELPLENKNNLHTLYIGDKCDVIHPNASFFFKSKEDMENIIKENNISPQLNNNTYDSNMIQTTAKFISMNEFYKGRNEFILFLFVIKILGTFFGCLTGIFLAIFVVKKFVKLDVHLEDFIKFSSFRLHKE